MINELATAIKMLAHLESLTEIDKRHAIVDIECMIESKYGIDEQIIDKYLGYAGYDNIIRYLDSLDGQTCSQAIADIKRYLEREYNTKER